VFPPRESLTRVPLSTAELPPLDLSRPPWPGELVASGGVRAHVRRIPGPGEGASTAVYVHGLGGSATNWTDLAAQLAGRFAGIAVDLPGFGRSAPSAGYDFSLAAHAATVTAFVDGLGVAPVHLFGHSLGGTIALAVAAGRPDLVRSMTLISPAMPDLRPDLRRIADRRLPLTFLPFVGGRIRAQLAALTPREQAEQILRLCFVRPWLIPEHRVHEGVQEIIERDGLPYYRSALTATALGLIRSWLAPPARSLWRVASTVSVPTLVVWGAQDRVVSVRKAPRTARLLPRGRLLVLPRTGHCAQIERPVTVARAVLGMVEAVDGHQW